MFSKRFLGFFFFGFLLALPLLLSVRGFSQDYYNFVWKLDGNGSNYKFEYPKSIAVDSKQNLYVADFVNYGVLKFDKDCNYLYQLGEQGTGPGKFDSPILCISIDKNDNVYVTCGWSSGGPRVEKFNSEGEFIEEWIAPTDAVVGYLDVDNSGNVHLVATGNPVIRKYDSSWNFLGGNGYCGSPWNDDDVLNFVYPGDIAVNSRGDVFATVWGEFYCGQPHGHPPLPDPPPYFDYHSQIKKFDINLLYVTRWYLDHVVAIAIDSEDNVYACSQRDWDMGVYKYDSNGNLIQRVVPNVLSGDDPDKDGKVWCPHSIAVDSEGNVYVGDIGNRIQKFAPPYVPYAFDGFLPPIENAPVVNQAKAGQTIPVKWRILDNDGLPVSDPATFVGLTSYPVSCSTFEGDPINSVEESAAGASGLQYLGDGWWQYNWKTSKAYAGQCRTMKLTLDDKTEHTASFSFK